MAQEPTVRVGLLASLSGNWAEIGQNLQRGAKLAVEELNSQGGVLGKELSLVVQDTDEEKSGAKVVSSYRYLRQTGINFFVGPTGVPGIMALTPIAKQDDMILLAPTSTNSFYKSSPKFFNSSGDNFLTTAAAAKLAYDSGVRRVAIFGSLQPWESDQAAIFKSEFSRMGGLIVAEEYPPADQTDHRIEALRIVKSNPDGVFFAIFNQIASASRALKINGFKGRKYAAIIDKAHIEASAGSLEGTEIYLFNPPGANFVDKFHRKYDQPPGVFSDSAYDAVLSLGLAINQAKSLDRERVISELGKLSFIGSSGELVRYDSDGLLARGISRYRVVNDSPILVEPSRQ